MLRRSTPTDPSTRWLLRRHDQATTACVVVVALVALAVWWLARGGASGRLVEIDRQPHELPPLAIDINTATWPELALLPGIGETLAKRIIESREHDGPYPSLSALLRVNGLGPKKLERMRPLLKPIEREPRRP